MKSTQIKGYRIYNLVNTSFIIQTHKITQKLITFTKYFLKKVHLLLHLNESTTIFSHGIWIKKQQQMPYFSTKIVDTIPFSVLP